MRYVTCAFGEFTDNLIHSACMILGITSVCNFLISCCELFSEVCTFRVSSLSVLSDSVLSQMLSEDGELMIREKVEAIVRACDSSVPEVELDSVFKSEQRCRVEDFQQWLLQHPHMASFSTWLLLQEEPGFSLEGAKSSLNFYETLGEKFGGKSTSWCFFWR